MEIRFACPYWGCEQLSFRQFAAQVKKDGYDAVETGLPLDPDRRQAFVDALGEQELHLIAQHSETHLPDFSGHKAEFEKRLRNLADARPLLINSQTGKDWFSFEQNRELIELADTIAAEIGIPVVHETHRGRFSFAAHITRDYLQQLPGLRLALDASHWCCVAESMLHDQAEAMALAIERTDHLHARIGFEEGPQVNDPRAPEWESALKCHLEWWDAVIERARQEDRGWFLITPEFGAEPYMPEQPFTRTPLCDQREANLYMKQLLAERYQQPRRQ